MGNDASSDSGSNESPIETLAFCQGRTACMVNRQGANFVREWAAERLRSADEAKESQRERIREVMDSYDKHPFSGVSSGGGSSSSDYPDRDSDNEGYAHSECYRSKYKLCTVHVKQRATYVGGRFVLASVAEKYKVGLDAIRVTKRISKVNQLNLAVAHHFGGKDLIEVVTGIAAKHFPEFRAADIRAEVVNYPEGCIYSFCGEVTYMSVCSSGVRGAAMRYKLVNLIRKTLWNTAKRNQMYPPSKNNTHSAEAGAFLIKSERVVNKIMNVR